MLVTAPDEEQAAGLARRLVEERLAACGNIVPRIRSIYRWEGRVEDGAEALLLLKTRAELFERLRARVVELHPYECPEVLRLGVEAGHEAYLEWIRASVASSSD
ncbi:Periplasmic divalent cation tolerance protein CutA [Vulgatibacter incomptus]|uniref:Periplasmic divalent cation tolerance protein CutA n=1 Tax=Vulgatibacter incomptus TaxID=1391653 RepID=A0A0K1PB53_9BACT|nr:Periplasmic divalent cation tolerance protein CutA [Vulgatibacter incomptus]